MTKKQVLICGASGFIGRNIFERLSQRNDLEVQGTYRTRNFLPGDSRLIQADLTRKEDTLKITKDVDVIIQAAATTSGSKEICSKPYIHTTDNAVMNSYLFRSAYENNVKQVLFFSCTVMYPADLGRPVKETDLDLNAPVYEKYFGSAWTKLYIEKMCEFYSRLGRTKYTVLRHSNIYGPHDKFDLERSHVFGATVTKVMTTKRGKIVVWGKGEEERDLLYISDLVRFVEFVLARQENSFDIINVGSGQSIAVKDLVRTIIKIAGKNLDIVFDPSQPMVATKLALDIAKAKKILGWSPQVSLEEGIQRTLEWYGKQPFSN